MKLPKIDIPCPLRPFALKQHYAMQERAFERWKQHQKISDSDIIRKMNGHVIFRQKETPPAPLPARSKEEQQQSFFKLSLTGLRGEGLPTQRGLEAISELLKIGDFIQIAGIAREAIAALATHARLGNDEAIEEFARLTVDAAEGLTQVTNIQLKKVRPVAGKLIRWPVMKSRHDLLCESDSVLGEIRLAAAVPMNVGQTNMVRSKPDEAFHVAVSLYQFLTNLRHGEAEVIQFPSRAVKIADMLPEPVGANAAKWWKAARTFLLTSYPDPTSIPELAVCCKTPSRLRTKREHKKGILQVIQSRFENLTDSVVSAAGQI